LEEEVLFQYQNGGGDDNYFLRSAPITVSDCAANVVATSEPD